MEISEKVKILRSRRDNVIEQARIICKLSPGGVYLKEKVVHTAIEAYYEGVKAGYCAIVVEFYGDNALAGAGESKLAELFMALDKERDDLLKEVLK